MYKMYILVDHTMYNQQSVLSTLYKVLVQYPCQYPGIDKVQHQIGIAGTVIKVEDFKNKTYS